MKYLRWLESPAPCPDFTKAIRESDPDVQYTEIYGSSDIRVVVRALLDVPGNVILIDPIFRTVATDPNKSVGHINQFMSTLFTIGFDAVKVDINLTPMETQLTERQLDYWVALVQSPLLTFRDTISYIDLKKDVS